MTSKLYLVHLSFLNSEGRACLDTITTPNDAVLRHWRDIHFNADGTPRYQNYLGKHMTTIFPNGAVVSSEFNPVSVERMIARGMA